MFDYRTIILCIEQFHYFMLEQNPKNNKNEDTESTQKHSGLGVIFFFMNTQYNPERDLFFIFIANGVV